MAEEGWLSTNTGELLKHIFQAEHRRLRKTELELVEENNRKMGTMAHGFYYRDHLFSSLDPEYKLRGVNVNPHPSLSARIQNHYIDFKEIETDTIRVKQALTLILRDCKTYQDIRDALPNSLAPVLPGTKNVQRTREEAYTVKDNPLIYKQYLKLREKIDFYDAARLLY